MTTVYVPTGTRRAGGFELAPRSGTLPGLRVLLLHNGKAPGDELLSEIGHRLQGHGAEITGSHRKRVSGAGAGASVIDDIVGRADVVVNALAD